MPRRAQSYIPDLPYHIIQRDNNREACFIEPKIIYFILSYGKAYRNTKFQSLRLLFALDTIKRGLIVSGKLPAMVEH